jgi:hypothetical protein
VEAKYWLRLLPILVADLFGSSDQRNCKNGGNARHRELRQVARSFYLPEEENPPNGANEPWARCDNGKGHLRASPCVRRFMRFMRLSPRAHSNNKNKNGRTAIPYRKREVVVGHEPTNIGHGPHGTGEECGQGHGWTYHGFLRHGGPESKTNKRKPPEIRDTEEERIFVNMRIQTLAHLAVVRFVAAIYNHIARRSEKNAGEVGKHVVDRVGRMVSAEGFVVCLWLVRRSKTARDSRAQAILCTCSSLTKMKRS